MDKKGFEAARKIEVNEEPISKVTERMIKQAKEKYPDRKIKVAIDKCHVEGCKNESTLKAWFAIGDSDLGLKRSEGMAVTICTVVTCKEHSFKDNKNLLQEYMNKLKKEWQANGKDTIETL